MYAQDQALAFKNTRFATTSLGNLRAKLEDVDSGNVPQLWIMSLIDVLNSLVLVVAIVVFKKLKADVVELTDWSMTTMGDYSVWITPSKNKVAWTKYTKEVLLTRVFIQQTSDMATFLVNLVAVQRPLAILPMSLSTALTGQDEIHFRAEKVYRNNHMQRTWRVRSSSRNLAGGSHATSNMVRLPTFDRFAQCLQKHYQIL